MGRGRTTKPALARALLRAEAAGDEDIEPAWRWARKPCTLGRRLGVGPDAPRGTVRAHLVGSGPCMELRIRS